MDTGEVLQLALVRRLVADGGAGELRLRSGLSLTDVAHAAETSPTTIWRYENGQRVPRGEVGRRYARFLAELVALEQDIS